MPIEDQEKLALHYKKKELLGAASKGHVQIVYDNGQPAGFMYTPTELSELYIAPQFRGKGYASRLMDSLPDSTLKATTLATNKKMQAILKSRGFEHTNSSPDGTLFKWTKL
jgi:GNAT superfamily N-acetyltransferase